MTELITRSGAWLLQAAAALPDTVVMQAVTTERGWFETVTGIASGVMTLTLLVLTLFLAPAAWSFWRTFRKVRGLIDRVYADVAPITRHASNVADNLDYITSSIRNDVQQVNATIASANRRLQQAAEQTEHRLNEFNALLQVVQQEAEQTFVSTAAAVRGVRRGAAAYGDLDAALADDEDPGGTDDGDDDESGAETPDRGPGYAGDATAVAGSGQSPTRPRVRSARRRR